MTANDYNDEGIVRLGIKCIEAMTDEYISRQDGIELESYRSFLKYHLTNDSWLRSIVDPDEIIAIMERVRRQSIKEREVKENGKG